MKVKNAIYLLFFVVKISYSISPSDLDINVEKRREKEEKLRTLEKNVIDVKKSDFPLNEIVSQDGQKGTKITQINIEGNTLLSEETINDLTERYIGKYGGENIVNFLKELENSYLKKGYITTRVKIDMKKTNFKEGIVTYRVIEGTVEEIRFKKTKKNDKRRIQTSFPLEKGDIINIVDLDQGIDNLNSISSNNAKFDLLPGSQVGTTVVEVENFRSKFISGSINYNNLG